MFDKLKAGLGANSARKREEKREERLEEEKKKQLEILKAAQIGVFEDNIKNMEFGHMTVEITVYQGPGLTYEMALARFLKPEKEHAANLANSYSFALFQSILEEKINKIMYGAPIDTKNGTFEYFTADGQDIKAVTNQESFEVALNHLYIKRREDELLAFTFKPKITESRNNRLPVDLPEAEIDLANAGRSPKGLGIVLEGQSLEFPQIPTSPQTSTSPPISESAVTHVEDEPSEGRWPSATHSSPPTTPKSSRSHRNSKSDEDRPKSKLSYTISGVGSQIKKKLTGKETPVERRERLNSLWEEGERTTFKKGGEDEGEDDISKVVALEKDDDDDGAETEVEEEDEEISQEDRAVSK
jgi:hypothetical protein